GRLLTGNVFNHTLVNLGFDITIQQTIQQCFGLWLVNVIPVVLELFIVRRLQWQQLRYNRLLGHRVDKGVADQVQTINLAIVELVQHYLDRTNYLGQLRGITEATYRRNHLATKAVEECSCFCTHGAKFNVNILLDRKSTRLNSSHVKISYAVFCLKKKKENVRHMHSRT